MEETRKKLVFRVLGIFGICTFTDEKLCRSAKTVLIMCEKYCTIKSVNHDCLLWPFQLHVKHLKLVCYRFFLQCSGLNNQTSLQDCYRKISP